MEQSEVREIACMSVSQRDAVFGGGRKGLKTRGRLLPATLSAQIIDHIRGAVFARTLHPGDHLGTEGSLASHFGVSRMAVRDALRSLQALGLVNIRKGQRGGITVAEGDPDRLSDAMAIQLLLLGVSIPDLFDAQFAIVHLIAELAAKNITAGELEKLRTTLDEADQMKSDVRSFQELIFEFHVEMAKASRNPALVIPLRAYMDALRSHYRQATTPEIATRVVRRYQELMGLLAKRDGDGARALITTHHQEVRRALLR